MNIIKEFEERASRLLGYKETLTVKEISEKAEDLDIDYLADALLEVDVFTKSEATAKEIIEYFDSQSILIIPPDYHPVNLFINPEELYSSERRRTIRQLLFDEANKYYSLENKYRFDRDINKYRIQVRPYGTDIDCLYDFLMKTKEQLLSISKKHNDEIELCPYQLDNEVDGSIVYKNGCEEFYCLKFFFEDQIDRKVFITACMVVQVARNQEEFDKLGFVEN